MKKSGIIFVILSAVFFATGGILIKINTMNGFSINGLRSIIAFLVMGLYMIVIKHPFKFNKIILLGAFLNSAMGTTFTLANKLTTAANACVLQFTMPAFLILILWAIYGQKPNLIAVSTVITSFCGIVLFFLESLNAGNMLGNVIAVLSGFFYSFSFLFKKIEGCDYESMILLTCLINFGISMPFLLSETNFTSTNMLSVFALGVFQMGLAFICLNIGLETVSPLSASFISMIEPILNPILVTIFYGEKIGFLSLIGAVIVLGSALFYNISAEKHIDFSN